MVLKKTSGEAKGLKNVANKTGRVKGTGESALVDKNGNMLSVEANGKRDEKSLGKRQGTKNVNTSDSKAKGPNNEEMKTYEADDGTVYEIDDCVYIDSQRPDVPFFICSIKEFKVCKRECVYIGVKWFYRPSEVPESVYQLLVQDRNTENGSQDHILEEQSVKERELFVSDAVDTYSVNALRGKCRVKCLSEVSGLKEFIAQSDHFFFVLRYNPETRRLANHKGEIRVGPSHQVLLPECRSKSLAPEELAREPSKEVLTWNPIIEDYDLLMFIGAARSMAQLAGICKEGDTTKGIKAAASDETTINALQVLHRCNYDTAKALQSLVKRPFPKIVRMSWTEDDNKKFVKGLRQYGKNFYKIRKELLPEKETGDLVEYYYVWKKTTSAMSSRPHRRRRHNVLRRRNITRSAKAATSEFVELSSCSEDDYDSEDSYKDFRLYCCRHCYSSKSRSWHHGGYERLLLCSLCLEYFKKYGVMRKVEVTRDPPPYMFKGVMGKENDADYFINGKQLRSRRSTPNSSSSLRYGRSKNPGVVDASATRDSSLPCRKLTRLSKPGSPSGASTGSNTSSSGSNNTTQASISRRAKRNAESTVEMPLPLKRKKSVSRESDDEPETDQSEENSLPLAEHEQTPADADVASVGNRVSAKEDNCSSPTPISLDDPELQCKKGKFPARNFPNGMTSARTCLPFKVDIPEKSDSQKEMAEKKLKEKKVENEEQKRIQMKPQKSENKSASETISTSNVTSQHYDNYRKYMSRIGRYPYSGITGTHGGIMGHMAVPMQMDMPVFPWNIRPGAMKDFEWCGSHKASLSRGTPSLSPTILHPPSLLEGHIAGGAPIATDPVTGLHHSHSHIHTHYHVHPDHQPRSSLEQSMLCRNPPHEMWLHPNLGISAAHSHPGMPGCHPRPILAPTDDLSSVSPFFHGLYPPRELHQELMMSQGLKIDHSYPFYPSLLSREHFMRLQRPQGSRIETELRRLENVDEANASLLHRSDARHLPSPVFKAPENSVYRNSKITETIDLSKDD